LAKLKLVDLLYTGNPVLKLAEAGWASPGKPAPMGHSAGQPPRLNETASLKGVVSSLSHKSIASSLYRTQPSLNIC